MNAIAFGTKRVFHGYLRVSRKPLASMGLTAARFDLLAALYGASRHAHRSFHGMQQNDLRRALGVTAPVVTRMLHALESLGWLTRRRVAWDRRQRRVELTDDGLARIKAIYRVMLRAAQRWTEVAICFGEHRVPSRRLRHMDALDGYLRALRRTCGDRATLYYPWGHPDD
jgi:DNA-binding MarR family transcriptional regulator